MPLYEYYCTNCETSFEALRPMNASDQPVACPRCASTSTRRLISVFAAISKGNGSSRLVASSQGGGGCSSCSGGSCATCRG